MKTEYRKRVAKIKSCPFCGTDSGYLRLLPIKNKENMDVDVYCVHCAHCEARGFFTFSPNETIEKWNSVSRAIKGTK